MTTVAFAMSVYVATGVALRGVKLCIGKLSNQKN